MTFIKICGITNLEDARVAVECGADALGFNFYERSPRYIEAAAARQIIAQLPDSVLTVGVFVNETTEAVEAIANEADVQALQLHGDESPEYCMAFGGWFVIKALAVNDNFDVQRIKGYDVGAILLDASHPSLRGGTGKVADWSVAQRANEMGKRIVLAGGLGPENIQDAIATARPYGVDACSGLEVSPGKKDHERLKSFLEAIRASEMAES